MFPELEEIDIDLFFEEEASTWNGKTYRYDFVNGDFIYKNGNLVEIEGVEALKVWIEKVIRTEKYSVKIYEDVEYGVQIEDLFGSEFERYIIESELQREITEALQKNPFIIDITEWEFVYEGSKVTITFYVESDFEDFTFEMVV